MPLLSSAPGHSHAPPCEVIDAAEKVLFERRAFVRAYRGPAATVRTVSEMIEFFPFHLLIIATHCGDASGYRWTYEFTDSEGIDRKLVVDLAIGVGGTDDEDMLNVTQFTRFVSLDGVDWHDPKQKENLYVGRARAWLRQHGRRLDGEADRRW
jgi:hypothetical protein